MVQIVAAPSNLQVLAFVYAVYTLNVVSTQLEGLDWASPDFITESTLSSRRP